MKVDDATRAQIEAARPDASTWLTANAGSGKTRVLTDRVARLLLAGVQPQQILCLTYTKAAASEMQNRLFKRLGEWAMKEDAALRAALTELGIDGNLEPIHLRDARTLFARAIETPGGLKIQTIHSFCAAILRRFPLEAGVSPQFTEIEDRAADLLRADIVNDMAEGPDAPLVADLAHHYTGEDFASLTKAIIGKRDAFLNAATWSDILALFGQPPDLSRQLIEQQVFDGSEAKMIAEMVPHMLAKGGNDAKTGAQLASLGTLSFDSLPVLEKVFLTGSGAKVPFSAKIGSFPAKQTQKLIAHLMVDLDDLMARVEQARDARLSLNAAIRTQALHNFANVFVRRYEAAKQARGWLDFDDLILKTRTLLSDPNVAAWVLYRIDGGIDHILVDEAQDTSPTQWDVIEKLTDEFYSGDGVQPEKERTLFVVGDKKQSIYSFQGADPDEFDRKAGVFEQKVRDANQLFQNRSLDYSFRSSSAILRAVDQAFDPRVQEGLDKQTHHLAFKGDLPGQVDLWPIIEKAEDQAELEWTDPVDRRSDRHHTVILAEQIAARIKELTDGLHFIPDDGATKGTFVKRPIKAKDFLILVQRRGPLFVEIIRACKAAGLPIAGADRLKVGAEMAVKDLAALLSFLATPDDSLSLATALKSPLFGWSEQDLFTVAHYRTQDHLWQALRGLETYKQTLLTLNDLRDNVDFLRPYDLIERILTRHGGRGKLLARLGPEAEDGINAMLSQALAYERTDIPSLTGFLQWMQTDDLEIKRQVDSSSNQIRVMTVHGAKGLEAPIVILPDTGQRVISITDDIVMMDDVPVWKTSAADMPQPMVNTVDEMKAAQFRERLRLLYVAMTRAEKWLIVAAAGDLAKDGNDWYQITQTAMQHINATQAGESGILRFQVGDWDALPKGLSKPNLSTRALLEPIFTEPAQDPTPRMQTLSPSDLGGAKALAGAAGDETETAMQYGSLVHLMLENAGVGIPEHPDKEMQLRAQQEADEVLNDPALRDLFAPETLAEVSITADIKGHRLHGTIDRLVIKTDRILAVDFKTNRVVPSAPSACPDGLLRQMGAYALMLQQVYPDHHIETAILWTARRALMVLPHDIVSSSVQMALELDVTHQRS